MTKLVKIGMVIALILGFTSILSAGNVKVEDDFITTIENAYSNNSLKKLSNIEGKTAYGLKFTDYVTDEFDKLNTLKMVKHNFSVDYLGYEIENSGLISMGSEKVNGKYQCVGLVKAVAEPMLNGISTQDWQKGRNIVDRTPRKGYVIATFGSNNKYDFGHVAIVLAVYNDYILVIDQNWSGTGKNPTGQIYIHAINNTGTGVTNINNYYIVRYP